MKSPPADLETDPRFPSGPWTGFFLDRRVPGRHRMELGLTFRQGVLVGDGRDWVGKFVVQGRYDLANGRCYFVKRYLGKHDVNYQGFNEGKGIWGVWEIVWAIPGRPAIKLSGGFHIWPEGMADPSHPALSEQAELPVSIVDDVMVEEPQLTPV
jgi:hypothetical protein